MYNLAAFLFMDILRAKWIRQCCLCCIEEILACHLTPSLKMACKFPDAWNFCKTNVEYWVVSLRELCGLPCFTRRLEASGRICIIKTAVVQVPSWFFFKYTRCIQHTGFLPPKKLFWSGLLWVGCSWPNFLSPVVYN